jgi:hypothetical protein
MYPSPRTDLRRLLRMAAAVISTMIALIAVSGATASSTVSGIYFNNNGIGKMAVTQSDGTGTDFDTGPGGVYAGWSDGVTAVWTTWDGVYTSTANGLNVTRLAATSPDLGGSDPRALMVTADHIYFTRDGRGTVSRMNRDGSQLVLNFITGIGSHAYGLAMQGGRIYIADQSNQSIGRASIYGGPADAQWIPQVGSWPGSVAVDGEHVYWTQADRNAIGRANIDGTGKNTDFITLASGSYPWGIDVDGERIYWASYSASKIGRANLDGTGVQESWLTGASTPTTLNVVPGPAKVASPTSPPANTAAPTLSGTLGVDEQIAGTDGTWSPTPTEIIRRWQVSANGVNGWAPATGPGATTSTYTPLPVDVGKYLRFVVQAGTDAPLGEASVVTGTAVPVPAAAVNTVVPTVSGTAEGAAVLSTSGGTWTGPGPITKTYQWQVSPDGVGTWTNAVGSGNATSSYVVRDADAGRYLRVRVMASNGNTATAESAAVGPVTVTQASSSVFFNNNGIGRMARSRGDATGVNFNTGQGGVYAGWSDGVTAVWTTWDGVYRSDADGSNQQRLAATSPDLGGRDPRALLVTATHIYFTRDGQGTIARMKRDGTELNLNFVTGIGAYAYGLVTDGTFIYIADQSNQSIGRVEIDGGTPQVTWIPQVGSWPGSVAIDGRYVYWTQHDRNAIGRANIDGTGKNIDFITLESGTSPWGIDVDGQFIYWAAYGKSRIGRANLDGTGVVQSFLPGASTPTTLNVVPGPARLAGVAAPTSTTAPAISGTVRVGNQLTVDDGLWSSTPTEVLYRWQVSDDGSSNWSDAVGTGALTSQFTVPPAYAGKYLRVRVRASAGGAFATEYSGVTAQVPVPPTPVNSVLPVVSGTLSPGQRISASPGTWDGGGYALSYEYQWQVSSDGVNNWANAPGVGNSTASYTVAYADGGKYLRVTVTAGNGSSASVQSAPTAAVPTVTPRYLYYGTQGSIGRIGLDGSGQNDSWITNLAGATIGAIPSGDKIYWGWGYYGGNGGLGRADLNGSNPTHQWVADNAVQGNMQGVSAVTAQGEWVYFVRRTAGKVGRIKADGTNLQPALFDVSGDVYGIASDAEHLYWCQEGVVQRADLDGTNVNRNWITGVNCTFGIAVNSDYVFWSSHHFGSVGRADINGTDVRPTFISGVGQGSLYGVAADDQHVYWAREYSPRYISRADVDGGNVITAFAQVQVGQIGQLNLDPVPGGPMPVNSVAPGITGTARVGGSLIGSAGTWSNTPTRYSYQWEVSADGSTGWTAATGTGASSATYEPAAADEDKFLRLRVRAWNGSTVSAWVESAATAAVSPPPAPVSVTAPAISGVAELGAVLTASQGSWTGAASHAYLWESSADGSSGWATAPGAGASTSQYTVDAADLGRFLRVRVTATGAGGSTAAFSARLGAVTVVGGGGNGPAPGQDAPGSGDAGSAPAGPAPAPAPGDDCVAPPAGPVGVTIADDAEAVSSRSVEISLVWPRCARTVTIANDGSFRRAQTFPVSATIPWTLAATRSERLPKTVYVRFDASTQTFTDDVILDATDPVLTGTVLTRAASGLTLRLNARDVGSGLAKFQLGRSRAVRVPPRTRAASGGPTIRPVRSGRLSARNPVVRLRSANEAQWIRVGDAAGNWSRWMPVARG